jgi:single-strand DNA-binding protein
MVNEVTLIGNVGRDPEIRNTSGGTVVASFSVATSERWKDNSGENQERTEWNNCIAFGKTAELIGQYLNRGNQVYVKGSLQTSKWKDKKTGEDRYRTEIKVFRWQKLGRRDDSESSNSGAVGSVGEPDYQPGEVEDDDIPF